MLKAMAKRMKNEKGFTLIELLAVIVILAVIAAIAVPMIGNIISKTKDDAVLASARQIYEAAKLYLIGEKGGDVSKIDSITGNIGTISVEVLMNAGYLDRNLAHPKGGKVAPATSNVQFHTADDTATTPTYRKGEVYQVVINSDATGVAQETFTAAQLMANN